MKHQSQYPNTYYRVSLKAVIRNAEGKVLVNKERSATTWNLPGGGWDHEELEQQALARELREEIAYDGEYTSTLRATATFWLESKQAWLLWIVYDVTLDTGKVGVGVDSTEIAFIDPADFRDSTSFEEKWIYENLTTNR